MSNNNLHNEDRKINNWTALKPVRIACFLLIIALAFTVLNRFNAVDHRARTTGFWVDIILTDMTPEQSFFDSHMHNVINFALEVLRFESEESIQAGNHLIWVVSNPTDDLINGIPELPPEIPDVTWHDVDAEDDFFPEFESEFRFETFYDENGNRTHSVIHDRHGIVAISLYDDHGNIIQADIFDTHGNLIEEHIISSNTLFPVYTQRGLVIWPDEPNVLSRMATDRAFENNVRAPERQTNAQLITPDGSRMFAFYSGDFSPRNREISEREAIRTQLEDFRRAVRFLGETDGLKFHISDTRGNVLSNVAADMDWFRSQPVYWIAEEGTFFTSSHNRIQDIDMLHGGYWVSRVRASDDIMIDNDSSITQFIVEENTDWNNLLLWNPEIITEFNTATIYLAFTHEFFSAQNAVFSATRDAHMRDFGIMAGAVVLAFALFAVLMVGAGRRFAVSKAEGVHFSGIDKPFLDISLAFVVFWCIIWLFVSFSFINDMWRQAWLHRNQVVINAIFVVLSVAVVTPVLIWFMSFAKRVKAGKFWRHTLVYFIPRKLVGLLKPVWQGAKLMPKVALISVAAFFAMLFGGIVGAEARSGWVIFMFTFIVTAVIAFLLTRYALRLFTLEQAARKTGEGVYDENIDVGGGELGSIANSINNISTMINAEVEQRMKSERLKTELITNVSHDIRTPLTSIITYTDLLKKEGLDSEKAPEYLDILTLKSQRLKTLTDELFEAAKASTGNIDVNITELDLVSLINQVLGELDSSIKSSGLDLRPNLPESMHVKADGRLMWRVLENLLSNVFKYSLANSRVYIDVLEDNLLVRLDVKNISNAELNIDPAELMDRFKRGDDSRADGGNGLGLSIVQSFMVAQGGKFEISIDGDLFKASVFLPAGE